MTKVLKELNYVERLKMFISRMQTSNWKDGDTPTPPGPTPPTPSLTKFANGDIASEIKFNLSEDDFGNVLKNINWTDSTDTGIVLDDGVYQMIGAMCGEQPMILAMYIPAGTMGNEKNIYMMASGIEDNLYIYCSEEFDMGDMVLTKGFQADFLSKLNDGVYTIETPGEVTIMSTNFDSDINGVLIGK